MRGCTGAVEQGEVVAHFAPLVSAAMVRLCLGDLRKRGRLDHTVDNGKVYYISAEPDRGTDAPALRHGSGCKKPRSAPPTFAERILLAIQTGGQEGYAVDDVWKIVGGSKRNVKKYLQGLARDGKLHAAGSTKSRRYGLQPMAEAPKGRDQDRLPPPVGTVPAVRIHRQHYASGLEQAPSEKPEPEQEQPQPGEPLPRAADPPQLMFTSPGTSPIASMTADGRLLVVNGGKGVVFDAAITGAILNLIRTFDNAGLIPKTA